ncbi:Chaperone of endosialidase [Dyadobacter sp. SG02]|uniref:tail fiber domain-containing protein n=1 Tax=Dyadobacter sp. SG02 TaxID=1855291 RepID=UPI0008D7C778|nr:tail fiber domain-containing protein [Dyadobacter sp. SG02]SEJ31667.1 Chaperone of endosialidase [Dyadobacter sp. SG02]
MKIALTVGLAKPVVNCLNVVTLGISALTLAFLPGKSIAQVGIGTSAPQATLHVHDGSVLASTPQLAPDNSPYYNPSFPDPVEFKMKWFHDKSAFRTIGERVGNGGLDPLVIGKYSFASGFEVFATGVGATALGLKTLSSGTASFASGENSTASAFCSFAHGESAIASGSNSVALGTLVTTNGKVGAFVFGDNNKNTQLASSGDNQISMRFAGGYRFFTNSLTSMGVSLAPGGNSWQMISDVNKKENFSTVDGEAFLEKIEKMPLTSWNYKGQDPKTFRHYGPMAQDFFKAFGQDGYGTIGTDTTINQADLEGVNLIAVQALVKRTQELRRRHSELLLEVEGIRTQLAENDQNSKTRRRRRVLFSKL